MLGPSGVERSARPATAEDLDAVVALRRRYHPEWEPPASIAALLP